MGRKNESPAELLIKAPWWISAALALVAFVGMRWIYPATQTQSAAGTALSNASKALAPYVALFFVLLASLSAVFAARKRKLVDEQTSLGSLRALSWKGFEWMVGEAYRRKGYTVTESLGGGADGGIDLTLRRGDETVLVQCKQWKTYSVGAPVVREMFGLLAHHGADRVIIITSGNFTREAREFAAGKPMELVDGPALLELVRSVQPENSAATVATELPVTISEQSAAISTPQCPKCGSSMVLRTAKRGPNAGNQFWGCSTYPKCSGVVNATGPAGVASALTE
jgi:restriction system protein